MTLSGYHVCFFYYVFSCIYTVLSLLIVMQGLIDFEIERVWLIQCSADMQHSVSTREPMNKESETVVLAGCPQRKDPQRHLSRIQTT